jgi:hypothetical protein
LYHKYINNGRKKAKNVKIRSEQFQQQECSNEVLVTQKVALIINQMPYQILKTLGAQERQLP